MVVILFVKVISLKMSALHEAASTGDLELLEEQLAKGLNPSEPDSEWGGKTPLHIACSAGHKKCVYVLLKAGADVNAQTDSGWTPAHCACETGQVWYAFNVLALKVAIFARIVTCSLKL